VADKLRRKGPSRRPRPKWAHDWHPYEDYKTVHAGHLAHLTKGGEVTRDRLNFRETRAGHELVSVNITGRIECAAGVLIAVDKWLAVRRGKRGQYEVKGSSYSYHAWEKGAGATLVRYDTAHGIEGLHRHRIDPETRAETRDEVSLDDLPTLADFIVEPSDSQTLWRCGRAATISLARSGAQTGVIPARISLTRMQGVSTYAHH
jgi:hypothetical protein